MSNLTKLTGIILAGLAASAYSVAPKSTADSRGVVAARTNFSINLSGPTMMGPNDACWWFATAQGGTPPYTYSWQGGSFVETTEGTSALSGTGPIHVTVHVSDDAGNGDGAAMDAQVDENMTGCQ